MGLEFAMDSMWLRADFHGTSTQAESLHSGSHALTPPLQPAHLAARHVVIVVQRPLTLYTLVESRRVALTGLAIATVLPHVHGLRDELVFFVVVLVSSQSIVFGSMAPCFRSTGPATQMQATLSRMFCPLCNNKNRRPKITLAPTG